MFNPILKILLEEQRVRLAPILALTRWRSSNTSCRAFPKGIPAGYRSTIGARAKGQARHAQSSPRRPKIWRKNLSG